MLRDVISRLIAVSAVIGIAGCAYLEEAFAPKEDVANVNATPDQKSETVSPKFPPPPVKPRQAANPPPPQALFDPQQLVGLGPDEMANLIGQPDEITDGRPETIWHYRTASCAMEVFFYPDLTTRALRALAYDVKLARASDNARQMKLCAGRIQSEYRDGKR